MFLHPWWLILLVSVPLFAWRMWTRRAKRSIEFSSAATGWHERPTWRQRLLWLPAVLSLAALTLMIISLARPRYGRQQTVVTNEGIAIELVVDRSGSMQALDFQIDGSHVDRLTAIKNVASKFILGNEDVRSRLSLTHSNSPNGKVSGRVSDLIGLVTFAGYADAITPPTLDHTFLVQQLENTEIVNDRREDGTAIGDALSLAIDKLSSLGAGDKGTLDRKKGDNGSTDNEKIHSKVIILLTDGENTAGQIEPSEAAELAKAMKIKVYTIGVGTQGRAPFPVGQSRSGQIMVDYVQVTIDEETLKQIASETGGRYFRATDTKSLEKIYEEIDKLEKTKVETQQFADFREMAVQTVRFDSWTVPPLLWCALLMLAGSALLRYSIFREFS